MVADLCHFVISFCRFGITIIAVSLNSEKNNEINKVLFSTAEYFAPLFIVIKARNLSSFRHEITINFVFSLFRAKRRNNEKTQNCVFSTSSFRYFGAKSKRQNDAILRLLVFSLFWLFARNNEKTKLRLIVIWPFRPK